MTIARNSGLVSKGSKFKFIELVISVISSPCQMVNVITTSIHSFLDISCLIQQKFHAMFFLYQNNGLQKILFVEMSPPC